MFPRVLIVYGTTDGHTKKIAEALARTLRSEDCRVDALDARLGMIEGPFEGPGAYDAIIVAASVHAGGYQRSVRRWVKRHLETLRSKPNAFVSVCLGVLEKRAATDAELARIMSEFLAKSGWEPGRKELVAGAIPYTRYGLVKKWVMKRIAAKAGGGTDTTRDYEYTDWEALDRFGREFARQFSRSAQARSG